MLAPQPPTLLTTMSTPPKRPWPLRRPTRRPPRWRRPRRRRSPSRARRRRTASSSVASPRAQNTTSRPLLDEPCRDRATDAPARAGDERDLPGQPELHASILEVRYAGHAATRMDVTRPTLSHDRLCRLQDGDVDPELGELDRRVAVLVLEGAPRALDSDDHHSAPRASTTKQSWVKGVSPDPESSSCASRTHGS